jgi:hypothetical protein
MILLFALFWNAAGYYKEDHQIVLTTDDLSYLVRSGMLTQDLAENIWKSLVSHSKVYDSKTNCDSELLLFGLIPIVSIILHLGGLVIVVALQWALKAAEGLRIIWVTNLCCGICCLLSLSIGYGLYEAYGTVLLSFVFILSSNHFLIVITETLITDKDKDKPEDSVFNFNLYEGITIGALTCINYYSSLFIPFPLIQVLFFGGYLYLVGFSRNYLNSKGPERYKDQYQAIYLIWSIINILYMSISKEKAFIILGTYEVDFRFIGYLCCSLVFSIFLPWCTYTKYCLDNAQSPDNFSVICQKYFKNTVSEEWMDYHKYLVCNMLGNTLLLALGLYSKIICMVILGYLGIIASIQIMPMTVYSNLVSKSILMSSIMVSFLIGTVEDQNYLELYAFYPRFYVLSAIFLATRLLFILISLIISNKYKSSHYTSAGSYQNTNLIVFEFILNYFSTIALIILSEIEGSWVMGWIYTFWIILDLDPTLKVDSSSYSDEIVRCFGLLLYGLRVSLISSSSYVLYYTGIFVAFIGLYKLSVYSISALYVKYFAFIYIWGLIKFSCCARSWVLITLSFIGLGIVFTGKNKKYVIFNVFVVFLIGFWYFFGSIDTICLVSLEFNGICEFFGSSGTYFPEKEVVIGLISYFR